jgi:hypothetical protein
MSKPNLGARLLQARMQLAVDTAPATKPLPDYVNFQLARLRLLHDLPFRYLVPDARLLPDESARFFTLDEAWLAKLVTGALSAAGSGSRERARAEAAAGEATERSAQLRYSVRKVSLGRTKFELAVGADKDVAPGTVSGMLLRSRLVSQWPNFALRAWTTTDKRTIPDGVDPAGLEEKRPELVVPILRMERLAPSVMLALFDGVPRMFWLEEPHGAVQFGLTKERNSFELELRDEQGRETATKIDVPMRLGGQLKGVVDINGLAMKIDQERPLGVKRGSAGLAMQLLRAPARQRFEN